MSEAHAVHVEASYRSYWVAWLILLGITVAMLLVGNRMLLMAGITLKSVIIGGWFMHLKHEKPTLIWSVVIGFLFALFLFFLIHFDARLG